MGVTTTNNKPFNPRGNDQSPKGYNRAKLFSGKALDFDGVNDNIAFSDFEFTAGNKYSLCIYANRDNIGTIWSRNNQWLEINFVGSAVQLRTYDTGWNTYTLIDDVPANEWHQIIITYDVNANTWESYLNGQFVKSITAAEPDNKRINRIGSTASGFYNGEFANAKIFDVALTAAQVADLYNNPEKVVPTGLESNLKLWLPMMEGAGTTAYNGAPDALGSELVTNGTFDTDSDWTKGTGWSIANGKATRSGASSNNYISQDFNVVSGTTYMLKYDRTYISGGGETNAYSYFEGSSSRVTRGQYTGTAQETVTVLDTFTPTHSGNLAFRFYGIGTFTGSIDNIEIKPISGIGTISGATWTHGIGAPVAQTSVIDWNKIQARTNGGTLGEPLIPQGLTSGRDLLGNLFENVRKQGALNLDGNSYAEVHDNASLDLTTAVTLEAWVYWTGSNSSKGILGRWFSGVASYMFYASTSTQLLFFINTSNSPVNISGTGWKHIVGTYDSTNRRVYIDGQEIGSGTGYTSPIAVGDKPIEIGRYAGNTAYEYDGEIAQPRIYNRALTAEEVQRNYNAGKNTYTN
jgi:hypothetical protein